MRLIKKIVGLLALILVFGGIIVFFFTFIRNKALLEVLVSNSIVKGSMPILSVMGCSLLAVIVGLLFFSLFLRLGAYVRKIERERQEELLEQQRASEEMNRQLREEAENAKAETEKLQRENELMKMTFMRKKEDSETAEEDEQA